MLPVADGRRLPLNSRQRIQFNGSFVIDPVDKSADSGVYTCEARGQNSLAARQSLNLNVIGKLSRPYLCWFGQLFLFLLLLLLCLLVFPEMITYSTYYLAVSHNQ